MFCNIIMERKKIKNKYIYISSPTNLELHLLIFKLFIETAYKASELDILLN